MKGEKGTTFIEVLIALALFGVIATVFLSALSGASEAGFTADERATAESLARSQIEYVKDLPYAASYTPDTIPAEYSGYSTTINTASLPGNPAAIQEITVTISHNGRVVITLEGYKVNR